MTEKLVESDLVESINQKLDKIDKILSSMKDSMSNTKDSTSNIKDSMSSIRESMSGIRESMSGMEDTTDRFTSSMNKPYISPEPLRIPPPKNRSLSMGDTCLYDSISKPAVDIYIPLVALLDDY